ncbi:MAG TPA: FIST N-terminal domain-containing protein, partial [Candidatus Thermoplasmatota archaeon]|nr:FIST N-terminal domain-containing protein [Candidatus Thermoplasmatota archaeon]
MQVDQRAWSAAEGWSAPSMAGEPDLVIVFGGGSALEHPRCLPALAEAYPRATIFGCSTAGEIQGTHVTDDSVIATTVRFAGTRLRSVDVPIADASDSRAAGTALADALDAPDLVHVLVLSDGL